MLDVTMKLEAKYILPTSSSGVNFYIYQLSGGMQLKKSLHMVLRCKRIHKPGQMFSEFSQILMELCGSNVQLAASYGKLSLGSSMPWIHSTKVLGLQTAT